MTMLLEKAEAQLAEINANRPKVYRAWEDTWTAFKENPIAYEEAYATLLAYDIEKNRVLDEVERLTPPEVTLQRLRDAKLAFLLAVSPRMSTEEALAKLKERNT
jgi:hypothetical protein